LTAPAPTPAPTLAPTPAPTPATAPAAIPAPACYYGYATALFMKEKIHAKILSYSSTTAVGYCDIDGDGVSDFTCRSKPFTKVGDDLIVDLSDCGPDGAEILALTYDPVHDRISSTVHVTTPSLTKTAKMNRITCPSNELALINRAANTELELGSDDINTEGSFTANV